MRESEKKRYIKNIGIIIEYLDKVINESMKQLDLYKNSNPMFSAHFIDPHKKRLNIAKQCKENLALVLEILNTEVEAISIDEPTLSFLNEQNKFVPGKFMTEVLSIRDSFKTLLPTERIRPNNKRVALYDDCVKRLNYVYSNIYKVVK